MQKYSVADNSKTENEEEDESNEEGVFFYINKGGFPITDYYWSRMWSYASKLHPEGKNAMDKVRGQSNLAEVPPPAMPHCPHTCPIADRMEAIQNLIDCAKEIIRESLPIKCLEAVILGIHLTNGIPGLDRFPISFKSTFMGTVHRHVVLGLHYGGRYGSLGMSRRPELMFKPLKYTVLGDMLVEYIRAYNKYWHEVKKVKLGLPVTHETHSYETVCWKAATWTIPKISHDEFLREVEKHAKLLRAHGRSLNALRAVYKSKPVAENLIRRNATLIIDRQLRQSSKESSLKRAKVKPKSKSVVADSLELHQLNHRDEEQNGAKGNVTPNIRASTSLSSKTRPNSNDRGKSVMDYQIRI